MNYIVFDLEFNQTSPINPKLPFEIIQIGAIKLDENFNIISTLDSLVRPIVYLEINPYVENMTGIQSTSLENSMGFKEVAKKLLELFDEDSILCIWGLSDMKEIHRNFIFHNLNTALIPNRYINIQRHASKYFKYSKGISVGLNAAVELLNLPMEDRFHDAFNDAKYTCEILKKLYSKDISIDKYIFNASKRSPSEKSTVDLDKLFLQFEKMLNKNLTKDEKYIIKLAYNMGRTNQFEKIIKRENPS